MGIRHHSGHAIRQGDAGKLSRIGHGAFNMHMDVNKAWDHISAPAVYDLCSRIAKRRGNLKKPFPCNCYIPFFKTLPVSHKDQGIFYHEINFHKFSPGI